MRKHIYRLTIPDDIYNQLKLLSITEGLPMGKILLGALKSYIEDQKLGEVDSDTVNTTIQAHIKEKVSVKAKLKAKRIECNDLHIRKFQTFDEGDWMGPVQMGIDQRKHEKLTKEVNVLAGRLGVLNQVHTAMPDLKEPTPPSSKFTKGEKNIQDLRNLLQKGPKG